MQGCGLSLLAFGSAMVVLGDRIPLAGFRLRVELDEGEVSALVERRWMLRCPIASVFCLQNLAGDFWMIAGGDWCSSRSYQLQIRPLCRVFPVFHRLCACAYWLIAA